jgi:hypothetical protein
MMYQITKKLNKKSSISIGGIKLERFILISEERNELHDVTGLVNRILSDFPNEKEWFVDIVLFQASEHHDTNKHFKFPIGTSNSEIGDFIVSNTTVNEEELKCFLYR